MSFFSEFCFDFKNTSIFPLQGQKLRYGGEVFGWYELGPNLGHGMCGPVKRAVHRLTGEEVAIKTLSKGRYNGKFCVFLFVFFFFFFFLN